ncbi:MAG: spondin domain-containing protein [Acidimicrobiia bacterium]|nr:spondin domain-containing protein [Acidimicrobiia bacterium]
MKRKAMLVLALALLASVAVVPAALARSGGQDYTYRVTVENLSENQTITPVVSATHNGDFRLFRNGQAASNGIQQLAENGGVPVLAAELMANANVGGVAVIGSAPIAPGDYVSSVISTDPAHRRLSLAAMLICTNDGFAGQSSMVLPHALGAERTYYANSFDAGTEVNTEAYADLVPPCDGLGGTGMSNPALAENGVVHPHPGIGGGGDLTYADHGWNDPVLRITIERIES